MVLNREYGVVLVAQTFDGIVVEVDFRHNPAAVFDALCVRREPVVLRGNRHFARFEIFDGLVAAAVSELELVGFCADCVRDDLMPEADAESRDFLNQFRNRFVCVGDCRGVARAVGKEETLRGEVENFRRRDRRGEYRNVEAVERESAENRGFRAEVDSRTFEERFCPFEILEGSAADGKGFELFVGEVEVVGLFAGDFANVVHTDKPLPAAGFFDRLFGGDSLG